MGPACANVGSYPPMRPPKPMECADKPSWTGDGQVCFPCIGPMTMGWLSLNRPMNMLFRRMLTNIKGHAKRAQGVQYATKSVGRNSVCPPSRRLGGLCGQSHLHASLIVFIARNDGGQPHHQMLISPMCGDKQGMSIFIMK